MMNVCPANLTLLQVVIIHLISSVNSVCKNAALSHLMTDIYYICCCLCDVSGG
jgi:hypothetical protein